MQFLVTGYDGKDADAPARRQAVRDAHLAGAQRMYGEKKLLFAVAILDENGVMTGSSMVVEFASKAALYSEWLDKEPYVTSGVWQDIRIEPCKVPGFIAP